MATARALGAWDELTEVQQLKVLAQVTEGRHKALRRLYGDILSIGLGRKTIAGEVQPQLCLGFLVSKKSDRATGQVPPVVTVTAIVDGRRRRLLVPTDVEEAGEGGPQLATNAADGALVASPSLPTLRARGAICCLVKVRGSAARFVLSCHHVLTLSGELGGCRVQGDALVADTGGFPYAQLHEFIPMSPGAPSQTDAAISRVQPGHDLGWSHHGMQARVVDFGEMEPGQCIIYAPAGRQIPATFRKVWREIRLPYPGCVVQIATAYQFQAVTHRGESGSPVMDSNGRLFGMHFWGDPTKAFALAIPAGLIFGPGVFSTGTLELA